MKKITLAVLALAFLVNAVFSAKSMGKEMHSSLRGPLPLKKETIG